MIESHATGRHSSKLTFSRCSSLNFSAELGFDVTFSCGSVFIDFSPTHASATAFFNYSIAGNILYGVVIEAHWFFPSSFQRQQTVRHHSPLSGGSDSISQFCLLMLNRELSCRRSFLMKGPERFLPMLVGGGVELLLTFAVCGAAEVTVMLGGD